jgi:hypothetical protein
MRITVTIDDVMIEVDDETPNPTVEAIETILDRITNAAVQIYDATIDFDDTITFTPLPLGADDSDLDDDV